MSSIRLTVAHLRTVGITRRSALGDLGDLHNALQPLEETRSSPCKHENNWPVLAALQSPREGKLLSLQTWRHALGEQHVDKFSSWLQEIVLQAPRKENS